MIYAYFPYLIMNKDLFTVETILVCRKAGVVIRVGAVGSL